MTDPILKFRGEHEFLSNFARIEGASDDAFSSGMPWRGFWVPTAEHAYQMSKCVRREEAERIAKVRLPGAAKKYGRKVELVDNWDDIKITVMNNVLRVKFQIQPFRAKLIATGEVHLEEGNTWGDTFWGVCNGEGRNMLGQLLMVVRNEIRMRRW